MRVLIVTPAPRGSPQGNRRTATRWARLLRELGARVVVGERFDGHAHDLLIALHAYKSRDAVADFKRAHPASPAVVALTGTDLYRDLAAHHETMRTLESADRLVVLQSAALDALPQTMRAKARVILQSEAAHGAWTPPRRWTHFCVLGHLRAEKDPLRACEALRHLPDLPLRVNQAGRALAPTFDAAARAAMTVEPRYRWRGELGHGAALRLLRHSHALIVGSLMEGGAHVVSEAIVHGVPVIASDIPGNRGLLGEDYPGYFPVGDTAALAAIMRRAATVPEFLGSLAHAVTRRQADFSPIRERAAWRALIDELGLVPDSRTR